MCRRSGDWAHGAAAQCRSALRRPLSRGIGSRALGRCSASSLGGPPIRPLAPECLAGPGARARFRARAETAALLESAPLSQGMPELTPVGPC